MSWKYNHHTKNEPGSQVAKIKYSLNDKITIDTNDKKLQKLETWTCIELGRRMGVASHCCILPSTGVAEQSCLRKDENWETINQVWLQERKRCPQTLFCKEKKNSKWPNRSPQWTKIFHPMEIANSFMN